MHGADVILKSEPSRGMHDFEVAGFKLRAVDWPATWLAFGRERLPFESRSSLAPIEVRYAGPCDQVSNVGEFVRCNEDGFEFSVAGTVGEFRRESRILTVRGAASEPDRSLNNALRVWTSAELPIGSDGLMLHAASCILNGEGVALAGLSGAGKSTFAMSLSEAIYLSDDITLFDGVSAAATLLASPFYGSLGRIGANASARLRVVGLLCHGSDQTEIKRLRGAEAATAVLRHVVAFGSERCLSGPILDRVTALVGNVPIFDVARSLNDSSDEICRKLLAAAESAQ